MNEINESLTDKAIGYLRSYYNINKTQLFRQVPRWERKEKYIEAVDVLEAGLKNPGPVSEEFRKQPNKRWEGSYTQRIVAALQSWQLGRAKFRARQGFPLTRLDDNLDHAINLLRDYHDTMHVVYEERDQARRHRDELAAVLKTESEKLNSAKNAVRCPDEMKSKALPLRFPLVDGMVARAGGRQFVWSNNQNRWLDYGVDTSGQYYADQATAVREANAKLTYAETELRTCKQQLVDARFESASFRQSVKTSVKNALISAGVL